MRGSTAYRLFAPLVLLAGGLVLPVQADQIILRDGEVMDDVKVVQETYERIYFEYQSVSGQQHKATSDVEKVIHTQGPAAFNQGVEAMEAFKFDEAISYFERSAKDTYYSWAKQYSLYYIAECHRRAQRPQEAAAAYQKLLQDVPNTRFLMEAHEGRGLAALAAGDYSGAEDAFTNLAEEARSKNLGEYWEFRARILKGQVFEAQDRWSEARTLYQGVVSDARRRDLVDIEHRATYRELQALYHEGQAQDALSRLQTFLKTPRLNTELAAASHNRVGDCHRDKGDWKAALKAYLRVVLLHGSVSSEVPYALYHAAVAFENTDLPEKTTKANRLRAELKSRFGNSEWARKVN